MRKNKAIGTKFRRWFLSNLSRINCSISRLANDLHMSRRCIYRQLDGSVKPRFCTIAGYCWYFDSKEDPEQVWSMVEEDWVE